MEKRIKGKRPILKVILQRISTVCMILQTPYSHLFCTCQGPNPLPCPPNPQVQSRPSPNKFKTQLILLKSFGPPVSSQAGANRYKYENNSFLSFCRISKYSKWSKVMDAFCISVIKTFMWCEWFIMDALWRVDLIIHVKGDVRIFDDSKQKPEQNLSLSKFTYREGHHFQGQAGQVFSSLLISFNSLYLWIMRK